MLGLGWCSTPHPPTPAACFQGDTGKGHEGTLWGAGNELHPDPGGKNSSGWTLRANMLLYICQVCFTPLQPAPPPQFSPVFFLPLPGTHFYQPKVGTPTQCGGSSLCTSPLLLPLLSSSRVSPIDGMRERWPCLGRGIQPEPLVPLAWAGPPG